MKSKWEDQIIYGWYVWFIRIKIYESYTTNGPIIERFDENAFKRIAFGVNPSKHLNNCNFYKMHVFNLKI